MWIKRFQEHRNLREVETHELGSDNIHRDWVLTGHDHAAGDGTGIDRAQSLPGDNSINNAEAPFCRPVVKSSRTIPIRERAIDVVHHSPQSVITIPTSATDCMRTFTEYHAAQVFGGAVTPGSDSRKAKRCFFECSDPPGFEQLPITAPCKLIRACLRRALRAVRQPVASAVEPYDPLQRKGHADFVV